MFHTQKTFNGSQRQGVRVVWDLSDLGGEPTNPRLCRGYLYSLSKATESVVCSLRSLDILQLSGNVNDFNDLPSWAMDWSMAPDLPSFVTESPTSGYRASRDSIPSFRFEDHSTKLIVKGAIVDTVKAYENPIPETPKTVTHPNLAPWFFDLLYISENHLSTRTLQKWFSLLEEGMGQPSQEDRPKFLEEILFEALYDHSKPGIEKYNKRSPKYFDKLHKQHVLWFDIITGRTTCCKEIDSPDYRATEAERMRNSYLIPTEYRRLDQIAESPEFKAVLHLKLHGSQVEAIHREYSTLPVANRLVTTEKNRFGRVGIHVEAGDSIALVSGQKLPMFLLLI